MTRLTPTAAYSARNSCREVPASRFTPSPSTWPDNAVTLAWLGHATVLVNFYGVRILTDPVWSDRASPVGFAGPRRFQPVPVPIERLPPLDAVIISHDHYDHLDHAAIREQYLDAVSTYLRDQEVAGLDIVTWTLERSGNLAAPNKGFYYRKIDSAITREGDVMRVIDALAQDVGGRGIFSDWPATVSFYAGCTGMP